MKKKLTSNCWKLIGSLSVMTLIMTAGAQEVKQGFYMSTDGGINIIQNVTSSVGGVKGTLSMDPGLRWSLSAGYGFRLSPNLLLGLEAESGVLWNGFDSVSALGVKVPIDGDYTQVPFLGNVVLSLKEGKWVPYIGAGGGGTYSYASINSVGGIPVGSSGNSTDGAFQAEAGIKYAFTDNLELGLGYKYLAVFQNGATINNHAISAALTFRF